MIAQTTDLEYTDTQMQINLPGDLAPNLHYKILASSELPGYDTSNTVSAPGERSRHKVGDDGLLSELSFNLEQNYPNPFNPSTEIKYSINENALVQLVVYDILGREVSVLVSEQKTPGYYTVQFDASDLPSGMYIYRLKTPTKVMSKKMMLVK